MSTCCFFENSPSSRLHLTSIHEFLKSQLDRSDNSDAGIEVKSRCLTVYTSLLLMAMQSETLNLADFGMCLNVCCEGIMTTFASKGAGAVSDFKTQCVTIFNRFFLMKSQEVIQYVGSKVELKRFVESWLQSMKSMTSKKATRINSFAILTAIDVLELEIIYDILPVLLEHTFTDIIIESEVAKVEQPTSYALRQKRLSSFSYRKEELRKGQLLESHSLLKLFKETMSKLMSKLKSKNLSFPQCSSGFQEKAQFFLGSSS
jgi:hypothetical protein